MHLTQFKGSHSSIGLPSALQHTPMCFAAPVLTHMIFPQVSFSSIFVLLCCLSLIPFLH